MPAAAPNHKSDLPGPHIQAGERRRDAMPPMGLLGRWVATASFKWTEPAENRNRENLLVLDCLPLAESYTAEWELIRPDEP